MKNIPVLILVVFGIAISSMASAYEDYTMDIAASDISAFYIHTSHHPNESIGYIATLHMSAGVVGLPSTTGVCDSGFWIDSATNSAAYSMILAAVASQNDLNIHYSTQPTPWNNTHYCAIIRVGIN